MKLITALAIAIALVLGSAAAPAPEEGSGSPLSRFSARDLFSEFERFRQQITDQLQQHRNLLQERLEGLRSLVNEPIKTTNGTNEVWASEGDAANEVDIKVNLYEFQPQDVTVRIRNGTTVDITAERAVKTRVGDELGMSTFRMVSQHPLPRDADLDSAGCMMIMEEGVLKVNVYLMRRDNVTQGDDETLRQVDCRILE